jgi:ADP-ribosylglycohydrolase
MVDAGKVRAVVLGGAVGDALGLPAEYYSAEEIAESAPFAGLWGYAPVDRDVFGYQEVWEAGQWSDDTDQALAILDAFLDDPEADYDVMARAFAKHLLAWAERNPRGMGRHTRNVLSAPGYADDPIGVSAAVWAANTPKRAPNGAVMRTAVVGLLCPESIERTAVLAKTFAEATHAGPECVASAVAVSVAVATLVTGGTPSNAIQEAGRVAALHAPNAVAWMRMDLAELRLDDGLPRKPGGPPPDVGYAYKTMGAGFWAIRTAEGLRAIRTGPQERFEKCLERVLRAGGDTDTNGAVAGAMLGAREGMDGIPPELAAGLDPREELDRRVSALLDFHARG